MGRYKIFSWFVIILAIADNIYMYVAENTYSSVYIVCVIFLIGYALDNFNGKKKTEH